MLLAAGVALAGPGGLAGSEEPTPPVAIVLSLTGGASVAPPLEAKRTSLMPFDWLPPGAQIEVEPGSRLTLVLSNGNRYELVGRSKAVLTSSELRGPPGLLKRLDPVPPMARITALAPRERPGTRSGALRLRAEAALRIAELHPRAGCTTLADRTVLSYSPIPGAVFKVEVEEESGRTILEAETRSSSVQVSPGILRPGERYYWKVWTLGGTRPAARAEGDFRTLAAEDTERRAALKAALEEAGDVDSLALVAEIDRRLGLLLEARDAFRALAARFPAHAPTRRALDELEARLSEE